MVKKKENIYILPLNHFCENEAVFVLLEEKCCGNGMLPGLFKFTKTAKHSSFVRISESAGVEANSFVVMVRNRIS